MIIKSTSLVLLGFLSATAFGSISKTIVFSSALGSKVQCKSTKKENSATGHICDHVQDTSTGSASTYTVVQGSELDAQSLPRIFNATEEAELTAGKCHVKLRLKVTYDRNNHARHHHNVTVETPGECQKISGKTDQILETIK